MLRMAAPLADAAESAKERFLKEAPQRWLEYRKIVARQTEVTCKYTMHDLVAGRIDEYDVSCILNLDGQRVRSDRDTVAEPPRGKGRAADVQSPKYSFTVRTGRDRQWALQELHRNGRWRAPDDLIGRDKQLPLLLGESSTFVTSLGWACLGQVLWSGWVPHMVSSPDFRLSRAEYFGDDGQLVKVEFEFEPKEQTSGGAPCRSGMMVLDTARYWLIREAETQTYAAKGGARGTFKVINEFTDGKLPVPFVSRQVWHVSDPGTKDKRGVEQEWVFNVGMNDLPNMDEKLFTLSAFGLPEPGDQLTTERRWWIWLLVLIVAVLVCILVARRSMVRR